MLARPIGSVFEIGGVDLIVVEHYGCEGCFFEDCQCKFPDLGACSPSYREDKKPVIFRKIEKTQKNT